MAVIVPGIGTGGRASCCGQFLGCLRCRWWSNYPRPGQYPRCLRGGPGIQQCVYMYALHCGPGIQQLYATSAFRGRGDLFCLLNMRSQEILCKSVHLSDFKWMIGLVTFRFCFLFIELNEIEFDERRYFQFPVWYISWTSHNSFIFKFYFCQWILTVSPSLYLLNFWFDK